MLTRRVFVAASFALGVSPLRLLAVPPGQVKKPPTPTPTRLPTARVTASGTTYGHAVYGIATYGG